MNNSGNSDSAFVKVLNAGANVGVKDKFSLNVTVGSALTAVASFAAVVGFRTWSSNK
jgi:hypothetical protein